MDEEIKKDLEKLIKEKKETLMSGIEEIKNKNDFDSFQVHFKKHNTEVIFMKQNREFSFLLEVDS